MNYRMLGKTGLSVSEIGFGGEWLERHNTEECVSMIKKAESEGIHSGDECIEHILGSVGRAAVLGVEVKSSS